MLGGLLLGLILPTFASSVGDSGDLDPREPARTRQPFATGHHQRRPTHALQDTGASTAGVAALAGLGIATQGVFMRRPATEQEQSK